MSFVADICLVSVTGTRPRISDFSLNFLLDLDFFLIFLLYFFLNFLLDFFSDFFLNFLSDLDFFVNFSTGGRMLLNSLILRSRRQGVRVRAETLY